MCSYIVNDRIYIYKKMLGICEIIKGKENVILKNSTDRFFVYGNKIISYSKEHKLNYMVYSQNKWNPYTIATLNKDIELKKIMVASNGKNENLFFSASIKGENLLIHCVLGDNAMPCVIGRIKGEEFFVYKNMVYFTNDNEIIGCCDFSDSNPKEFTACFEGELTYVEDGKIVYKKGDDIFINDRKWASDKNAQTPIIINNILMWKSGSHIRYISENGKMKQYVSNGIEPEIFIISDKNKCVYRYGFFSGGRLKLFS